jgi:uncharacterized membrane protein YeaQ/YmgE (transglycosylase-associated protein family)
VTVYLAIVFAVPLVAVFGLGPRARMPLLLTVAATWAVATLAHEQLVRDPDDPASGLMFLLVYVHLVTAPVAGLLARLLVRGGRGVGLLIFAALVGSIGAVVLRLALTLGAADDHVTRAMQVAGPALLAATFAVVVAALGARRTA